MQLLRQPVEWLIVYPVNPNDPIGKVRREGAVFRCWLHEEDLGLRESGDAAVEAIWARYLEHVRAEHAIASRTHGGYGRHA